MARGVKLERHKTNWHKQGLGMYFQAHRFSTPWVHPPFLFESWWCHWIAFCLKQFWFLSPEFVLRRNSGCLARLLLRLTCADMMPLQLVVQHAGQCLCGNLMCIQTFRMLWSDPNDICNVLLTDFMVFEDKCLHCFHIFICFAYNWCIFSPGDCFDSWKITEKCVFFPFFALQSFKDSILVFLKFTQNVVQSYCCSKCAGF